MPPINGTAAVAPKNTRASNITTGATLLSVLKVVNSTTSTTKTQATTPKIREITSTKNSGGYTNTTSTSAPITKSIARYSQTTGSKNGSPRGGAGKTTSRQQQRRTVEQQAQKNSTQTDSTQIESSDAKSSRNSTVASATKTTPKRSHVKPFVSKPAGSNSRNTADFNKTSNNSKTPNSSKTSNSGATPNLKGCCESLSAEKKPTLQQNSLYELPGLTYMVENNRNGTNTVLSKIKNGTMVARATVKAECHLNTDESQNLILYAGNDMSKTDIRLTKDTPECKAPILGIRQQQPSEVTAGQKFYHQVDKRLGYNLTINGNGTNTVHLGITGDEPMVSGYVKEGCRLDTSEVKLFQLTALEPHQGNVFLTKSTISCFDPIVVDRIEVKEPTPSTNPLPYEVSGKIAFGSCLIDPYTSNANGTVTHRIHNKCSTTQKRSFSQGCEGGAEFPSKIEIAPNETLIFLSQDSYRCRNRAFEKPLLAPIYCKKTRPKREIENSELPVSTTPFPDVVTGFAPEPRAEAVVSGRRIAQETRKYLGMLENSRVGWLFSGTCSGTMITNRHFLTAAHCLDPLPINTYEPEAGLSDLTVKFNAESRSIPCIAHKVKAAHVMPCFFYSKESIRAECDVALIELEKPIRNCEPIKLISGEKYCEFVHTVDDVFKTKLNYPYIFKADYNKSMPIWTVGNALVQGHGRTNNLFIDELDPHVPRETHVVVADIERKSQTLEVNPPLSGGMTCFGDSGGPLIYTDKVGEKWQVGVSSSGDPECIKNARYANVKNPDIASWLKERLDEDASVALQPEYLEDLSRVKIRPSTCVTKKNLPEAGWWGILTDNRRITITNHCNIPGYSNNVKVKLSSLQTGKVIDMYDNEGSRSSGIFTVKKGETRVIFTNGYVQADMKWTK